MKTQRIRHPLVDLWNDNYEVTAKPAGMTMAKRNYYKRLNNALLELRSADVRIIADENDEGDLEKVNSVISFSLNLMNTGLDQVFNPTLRD